MPAPRDAGRSRNDLVVTDLRLWVRDAAGTLADRARALAAAREPVPIPRLSLLSTPEKVADHPRGWVLGMGVVH